MTEREWVKVRVEMEGANKFIRDAKAAGASIQVIESSAGKAGKALRTAGGHGFWFNQAMFTIRRTIYGVTLALGALTAGAIALGFGFNSSMEQANMAFTQFLGSSDAATKQLNYLFELAAATPFEFPQLVDATRKFLAFGFSIDRTNQIMVDLADAVAGFGLGGEAIDRATLALGQMRSAGRVLGQDLRQLQELGLFSPEDFQKRLHLAPGFLGNVGNLIIPSEQAIDAITAYWESKFGGMSAKFATTWKGQLSGLKDYSSRLFGLITEPLFNRLKDDILPRARELTQVLGEGFQSGGVTGMVEAADEFFNRGGQLTTLFGHASVGANELWIILKLLKIEFQEIWGAISPINPLLVTLGIFLRTVRIALETLSPILDEIVIAYIAYRYWLLLNYLVTKLLVVWGWRQILMEKARWLWTNRSALAQLFMVRAMEKSIIITMAYNVWTWAAVVATGALTVAMRILTSAIYAIPVIGWILAAVAGLIILERQFHPIQKIVEEIFGLFRRFKEWVTGNKISADDFLPGWGALEWIPSPIGIGARLAGHFATGGMAGTSGNYVVGERGPEVVRLPAGASVVPNAQLSPMDYGAMRANGGLREIVIKTVLQVGGRDLAEAMSRVRVDAAARA